MKKDKYTCIRCHYSTNQRSHIIKHLYLLKKPCPAIKNNIELTDQIKQYILDNRVYHLPAEPKTIINNTINYNNTINNFIASMDPIEKLSKYISFTAMSLNGFSDTIEDNLKDKAFLLEDAQNDIAIDSNGLLEIVDQVSSLASSNVEHLNMLYDTKFNKLKVYEDGSWNEFIITSGIKTLLSKIQEFYFDAYEFYLIRKIELHENFRERSKCKELLIEYYKFIGCFDIDPDSKNRSDSVILYDEVDHEETKEISDRYHALYIKTRDDTKKSDINTTKRQVIDILKKNSEKNICELNKKVASLFHMEEEFKNKLI
jgi:hypothetical protein